MKILRHGSVKVTQINLHDQSYLGSLFACNIHTYNINTKYAKLFGKHKILIKLSTDENGLNPTIISTGESWKNYDYDDCIDAFIKIKQFNISVVFFHIYKMKKVFINYELNKGCKT